MNTLIKKSFKLDALWLHDDDNYNDWVANMETLKNLISLSDMIRTEKIFRDMLEEMDVVPTRYVESEKYFAIVYEKLACFIEALLLHLLNITLKDLDNWEFKTEIGQKFHSNVRKKLTALDKKYHELYDL